MRIEYEVFGATADAVQISADKVARDFFGDTPFRVARCIAEPFGVTFDGEIRRWRAQVVADDVTPPAPVPPNQGARR